MTVPPYFNSQRFDQSIWLQDLNIERFPKLVLAEAIITTPTREDALTTHMELRLLDSQFYVTPMHSHISHVQDYGGGTIELLLHRKCAFVPHNVNIPLPVLQDRKRISQLNWEVFIEEQIMESPGANKLGIMEVFQWPNLGVQILEGLYGIKGEEMREIFWTMLNNGQIIIMQNDDVVLVDRKHKSTSKIKEALEYYEAILEEDEGQHLLDNNINDDINGV